MKHEANLIKLLAALTAAPRWVTALVIADGGAFTWGNAPAWSIASAALSVLFAAVEVYAAAFIMRAWRSAKPGRQERVLFALWVVTLCALVVVMAPPIFANTTQAAFSKLPTWLLIAWSVCVAASTFLVIGGVGYSERHVSVPTATPANHQATISMPDSRQIAGQQLPKLPTAKRGNYGEFEAAQLANPMSAKEAAATFGVPLRTAYNWIGKFEEAHK